MILQLLTLHPHGPDLISHVTDNQSQNKELGNPHIGIVIHQHFKTASGIHLPEQITCHRTHGRKSCLLLPIYNGKEQHI